MALLECCWTPFKSTVESINSNPWIFFVVFWWCAVGRFCWCIAPDCDLFQSEWWLIYSHTMLALPFLVYCNLFSGANQCHSKVHIQDMTRQSFRTCLRKGKNKTEGGQSSMREGSASEWCLHGFEFFLSLPTLCDSFIRLSQQFSFEPKVLSLVWGHHWGPYWHNQSGVRLIRVHL